MVRLTVDVRAAIAVGDVPAPNKKCKRSYFVTHEQGLMIRQLSYIMCIVLNSLVRGIILKTNMNKQRFGDLLAAFLL